MAGGWWRYGRAAGRSGRQTLHSSAFDLSRSKRRPKRRNKSEFWRREFVTRIFHIESLEPRWALAANVVINEFLADNTAGIVDQNSDHSDWIELKNSSPQLSTWAVGI